MERREFITGSLGGLSLIALATTLPGCRSGPAAPVVEPVQGLLDSQALAVIQQLRGTTPVALAWKARHGGGESPDREELERRLLAMLETDEPVHASAPHFSERLAAAVSRDFEAGRLCEIEGWLLSETECLAATLRLVLYGETEPAGATDWRQGELAEVVDWGPRETTRGVGVNVQPDGHSGLWFKIDHAPSWLKIEIDGVVAPTVISEAVVTSGLYGELRDRILDAPGEYPIALVDPMQRIRQPIGHFVVKAPPPYLVLEDGSTSVFCAVEAWGPDVTFAGRPSNPQREGHEGLWIRTACAPDQVQVLYDGDALVTTNDRGNGLITALLPPSHFAVAREARLQLHDMETGEVLDVGIFVVKD